MKTHILPLALLCLFFSLPGLSQKTVIPATSFGERSLPYTILDIQQDSRGFIWFASLNGLVRYDGYNYTLYQHNPFDTASLAHDFVSCIIEDRQDGSLWVGTNNGLSHFDPRTEKFTNYYHQPGDTSSLPGNIIIRLAQSDNGDIWIGTLQDGLGRFEKANGRFRKYQAFRKENICLQDVWGIVPDGGRLWLGTGMGIFSLDIPTGRSAPVIMPDDPEEGERSIWVIAMRRQGEDGILVRLDSGKEYLLNPRDHSLQFIRDCPGDGFQNRVLPFTDREGNTWIALEEGGYQKQSPYSPKFKPFGIEHEGVTFGREDPIVQTADSALWLGHYGYGLLRIDGRTGEKTRYFEEKDSPLSRIIGLAAGPGSSVWALSKGMLVQVGPQLGPVHTFSFPDPYFSFFPSTIMVDSRGWVWAGSYKMGVFIYKPELGAFSHFYQEPGRPDSKDHNQIGDILEDKYGGVWVGTYGGGLYRLDPLTMAAENFQFDPENANSLINNQVNSLMEDALGRLWIGTGRGLSMMHWNAGQPAFFNWTTETSGLPNNRVFGILEDGKGNMWLSTDGGLACFNPEKAQFEVFSSHDGFRGVFLEQGDYKYQDLYGNMYFYEESGTVVFHPDSLSDNPYEPPVLLAGLKVNNQEIRPGGEASLLKHDISYLEELALKWWQNNLTIEFVALSMAIPEKNRYRYILEGHDKHWVETGASNRVAIYNNLPPGHYLLKVQASNNDGVWNETGTEWAFTIVPPWWKRWWAYTMYGSALLFLVYSLYRFQLNRRLEQREAERLKEMDVLKTRLYTNITHEFRTPLSIIAGMAARIKDNPRQWAEDGVQMIQRNTSRLLQLVNQMLELARLESGNLPVNKIRTDVIPFLYYLTEAFEAYAGSKDIRLHFLPRIASLEMDLDPEKLQQILSNLLSNAIKFTPEGGHVYVLAERGEYAGKPALELRVRDTGIGIPEDKLEAVFDRFYQAPAPPEGEEWAKAGIQDAGPYPSRRDRGESGGAGIGLSVARELARLLDGELIAENRAQRGATFTAFLPITLQAAVGEAMPGAVSYFPARHPNVEAIAGHSAKEAPTLLLVEDNADVIYYLASCLGDTYRLMIAANGKEGLEMAITHTPDLVISDVMMPKMDGYELCRLLKDEERTSHIPIILLTAKADQSSKLDGLKCGADAYLAKPFEEEELHVRIRKLLELRRRLQEHYRASLTGERGAAGKITAASVVEWPTDPFLEKIRAIIETHLNDSSFSVGQLCQEAGMSHSQLHRKLSALTGQSATYFIRYLRLQHAKALLNDPRLTVAAVAFDTGFSDPDYFSKVFRKEFGKTPSEYREQA